MNIVKEITIKTVSDVAYAYTDAINLSRTRYEGNNVFIKCDVIDGKATASFDINTIWSETSGGTYTPFITASGSSKVVIGGTTGAALAAGCYATQLTTVPYSGTTLPFKATGWLKIGTKSTNCDFDLNAKVII